MVTRLRPSVLRGLLALSLLVGLPLSVGAATDTPSRDARLAKGDIIVTTAEVKGASLPRFTVTGVVDAPLDDVWKLVSNCDEYERMMPRVGDAKVIKRKGKTLHCKMRVDLPFPLGHLDSVTAWTMADHEASHSLKWSLVSGDYKKSQGSWVVSEFGDKGSNRTLIVYTSLVVPKLPVPKAMVRKGQRQELPKIIKGIRKEAKAKSKK